MELTTGGVIITDAIKYVQGQMDRLNNEERRLLHDIRTKEGVKQKRETEVEEDRTTNGIF